jgi:hypothetical protein
MGYFKFRMASLVLSSAGKHRSGEIRAISGPEIGRPLFILKLANTMIKLWEGKTENNLKNNFARPKFAIIQNTLGNSNRMIRVKSSSKNIEPQNHKNQPWETNQLSIQRAVT